MYIYTYIYYIYICVCVFCFCLWNYHSVKTTIPLELMFWLYHCCNWIQVVLDDVSCSCVGWCFFPPVNTCLSFPIFISFIRPTDMEMADWLLVLIRFQAKPERCQEVPVVSFSIYLNTHKLLVQRTSKVDGYIHRPTTWVKSTPFSIWMDCNQCMWRIKHFKFIYLFTYYCHHLGPKETLGESFWPAPRAILTL